MIALMKTALEFKKHGINPVVIDTREDQKSDLIEEAKIQDIEIKFFPRRYCCTRI
jgi:hypothetical protein